ncbi:MAG: winged helix-turn-helix domain-containing protein [Clostridiales bacterium]|nr:winged helix-turn-helix domain-containing protein [Clostridiales bacterium]
MKKQIGYINLDASIAAWLQEHLPDSALKEGIDGILRGEYRSLMLEMDQDATQTQNDNVIVCKDLVISERARRVERGGNEILLTPKEYDILYFLAKNRGQVFTKEQIYQAVWESDYVMDDSNIMAFIRKLRKKIEPNPDSPEYILTIWGIGYKFSDKL